jgi:3'(2'), 5'-bisphosphate nucleotidase
MKISRNQLTLLCDIALAAGREVLAVYGADIAAWEKNDASPLTEADLRSDAVIRRELERFFPGIFVLSEESTSTQTAGGVDTFFLVDPLDGTKEFIKRSGEFTVNIALVHQGKTVAGVVFAPALDELFYAAESFGAFKISANADGPVAINPASNGASGVLRVVGSRSHGADRLGEWLTTLKTDYALTQAGSSLKFCRIAEGVADVYPRFGLTSQWDTAAAQCVLELAGGCVLDFAGLPLRYGLDRPVLNPEFVALGNAAMFDTYFSH